MTREGVPRTNNHKFASGQSLPHTRISSPPLSQLVMGGSNDDANGDKNVFYMDAHCPMIKDHHYL